MTSDQQATVIFCPPKDKALPRYPLVASGLHLLAAFWLLNIFFPSEGLSVEKVAITSLLFGAVGCLTVEVLRGFRVTSKEQFSAPTKLVLVALFAWCVITIFRGVESDVGRIITLLGNPDIGGLVWLLPFAIFIGKQPGVLNSLLPVFRTHALIGVFITGMIIVDLSSGASGAIQNSDFRVGLQFFYAAPILIFGGIGGRFDRSLHVIGLLLSVPANFLLSNRARFAITIVTLLAGVGFSRINNNSKVPLRLMVIASVIIAVGVMSVDSLLYIMSDEWLSDTRTFLFEEMNDDFSVQDWIFGRGALGSYYSPYFYERMRLNEEGDWFIRQVNEIGYLHISLKMGLVGVVLYVSIFLIAISKAIEFKGKRFGYALAMIFAMHLAEMFIIGQPAFLMSRVLLWIMVGIALKGDESPTK